MQSTHYSCPILIKRIFLIIFEKYSNAKFQVNRSSGSRVVTRGQTDERAGGSTEEVYTCRVK